MKALRRNIRLGLTIALLAGCPAGYGQPPVTWAERARAITLDNEREPATEPNYPIVYENPLLLNGKPLNYGTFSIQSRGRLSVVTGNPESPGADRIPFRIYLRRNGTVLQTGASDPDRPLMEVEVAAVLMLARPGDQLIIDPVRKTDCRAKRIIRVVRYFDWLSLVLGKPAGC